jgi:hypothetical protein
MPLACLSSLTGAKALDFTWAYLVSLMASPQEMTRLAAAQCALTLLRANGQRAASLVAKPWALFSCRGAVTRLLATPLDAQALPKSYLVYVSALMCAGACQDGRSDFLGPMLPASLTARLVSECSTAADRDDASALELLHALCVLHIPDEATAAALKRVVHAKIERLQTASEAQTHCEHADYHGARMFPSLLWGGSAWGAQPREDLLFRLRAKLHQ